MTGRHPGHSFVRDNRDPGPATVPHEIRGQVPIPADARTLADEFKSADISPPGSAIGDWADPARPATRCATASINSSATSTNITPTIIIPCSSSKMVRSCRSTIRRSMSTSGCRKTFDASDPASYRRFAGADYVPDRLADEALRFIDQHAGEPFFLYYPTTVPHVALQVPEESLAEYQGQWPDPPYAGGRDYTPHFTPRAAYAAMITRMDRDIGRLMQALADRQLAERTIVVFTSDNGPVYDRIGGTDINFFESAGTLRGVKGQLYEGGIRVPCIVRWTGHIPAGVTSDVAIGAEDWYATLPRLAGLGGELPAGLDGIDITPTLLGKSSAGAAVSVSRVSESRRPAVRADRRLEGDPPEPAAREAGRRAGPFDRALRPGQ